MHHRKIRERNINLKCMREREREREREKERKREIYKHVAGCETLKNRKFSFCRVVYWKMPPLCAIPGHQGIT